VVLVIISTYTKQAADDRVLFSVDGKILEEEGIVFLNNNTNGLEPSLPGAI